MNQEFFNQIAKENWTKNWSGNWGLLFGSLYGDIYTMGIKGLVGKSFEHNLITFENGVSSNYLIETELKDYCLYLVESIKVDESITIKWSEQVIQNTDLIMNFIENLDKKHSFVKEDYYQLQNMRQEITTANFSIKKVIDYLPDYLKEKNLPLFSKVRVYTEPVYNETDQFLKRIADFFFKNTLSQKEIAVLTKEEMVHFLESNIRPKQNELEERYDGCALLFDQNGKYEIFCREEYKKLIKMIIDQSARSLLKGMVAYKGRATGKVRIVLDPSQIEDFNEGDILVAGMTRPEYLSLMKKSGAFITDAGGLLSHAAIVARELKKPCIVGTEVATKVLKNGDLVEVDAEQGIVKVIR